jgi:hypothetical protein
MRAIGHDASGNEAFLDLGTHAARGGRAIAMIAAAKGEQARPRKQARPRRYASISSRSSNSENTR